jgi:hypothetical protein
MQWSQKNHAVCQIRHHKLNIAKKWRNPQPYNPGFLPIGAEVQEYKWGGIESQPTAHPSAAFHTRQIFIRHSFGMKWNKNAEGGLVSD